MSICVRLIAVLLLVWSGVSFAVYETYPVLVKTAASQCVVSKFSYNWPTVSSTSSLGFNPDQWSGLKCNGINSAGTWIATIFLFDQNYCNPGDSLSGSVCIKIVPCPLGTTLNPSTGLCEPICELPKFKNPVTGICDLPICKDKEETPVDTECKFDDTKGTAMNCTDGSTIYAPQICPSHWIDRYVTNFGNTLIQCDDGTFAAAGSTCYARFLKLLFNNDPDAFKFLTFGVGTSNLTTLNPIGLGLPKFTPSPNSPNGLLANFPMLRLNAPSSSFFNIASTVPYPALGKAISDFFKAEPTSPYVSQFKQNASDLGFPVIVNPNTGDVTPATSSVALSPNQLAQVAQSLTQTYPTTAYHPIQVAPLSLPIQQLSTYLTPVDYPWMLPGLHGIEADMNRIYSPTTFQNPVNFSQILPTSPSIFSTPVSFPLSAPIISTTPNTTTSILTNPVNYTTYDYTQNISNFFEQSPITVTSTSTSTMTQPVQMVEPLVIFDMNTAPSTYITYNNVSNTTITNINNNTNPTNTDALTTPIEIPTQLTAIDPNTPDSLPVPPTLYPDTWKYFDFLPMANPFSFNISAYLPWIPETSCYYEIHRVIFGFSFDFAPCVPLQPLRAVLQWAFAVLTAWACFLLIFRSQI